ncbi:MAG: AAA family ATPase, partial [Rhizobiaceae bacterium]|nr:AAA family ATPase [Rhizobiaceae bacterium]
MSFQELDRMSAEHRRAVGFIPQASNARAGLLAERLRPLNSIRPVLERRYLVKGWMDRGALSVVYGESNVGKTFLALDLALHVAAGAEWHGNRIHESGQVVYVAAEGGTGLHNRIEALRSDQPDLIEAAAPNFSLLSEGLDLCTGEDAQYLSEALSNAAIRPALIVIDTLARVMGDGDENAARDMGKLVQSVDRLRAETGAHVMVIHHSGKDGSKGARGSGSLRAAADTEIELNRADGIVIAEPRKQRDMACEGAFAYRLRSVFIGRDEDGDAVTSAVIEPADIPRTTGRTSVRKKVSGQAQVALNALQDAIRESGRTLTSPDLPNVPVVTIADWQRMCDRHGLSGSDKPDTRARMFRRQRDTLMNADKIRVWDNHVWLADKADISKLSGACPEMS